MQKMIPSKARAVSTTVTGPPTVSLEAYLNGLKVNSDCMTEYCSALFCFEVGDLFSGSTMRPSSPRHNPFIKKFFFWKMLSGIYSVFSYRLPPFLRKHVTPHKTNTSFRWSRPRQLVFSTSLKQTGRKKALEDLPLVKWSVEVSTTRDTTAPWANHAWVHSSLSSELKLGALIDKTQSLTFKSGRYRVVSRIYFVTIVDFRLDIRCLSSDQVLCNRKIVFLLLHKFS